MGVVKPPYRVEDCALLTRQAEGVEAREKMMRLRFLIEKIVNEIDHGDFSIRTNT
jgi:hypothetical protein